MIRTVKLEVNAANPQVPLMPSDVFEDSAATFVIIGVPRAHGKQTITGVTVSVVNPDGQSAAVPAVRDGSAWVATVHADDIGGSGKVTNGVIVSASGKDENDAGVEAWILGAGDLVVMQHDGTVVPGERLNRVNWFETAPTAPKIGSIAPVEGVISIYTADGWTPLGGSVTLDDEVTETGANGVKSSGIWSFVKGLLPSWLTPTREDPPTQASVAAKYTKPSDGIPKSDLVSSVQASLNLADTALQQHQDISGKADKSSVYTKSETDAKIVANVENSTSSTSVTKALSAKMGKELQDQIQNLKQRGRYLSIWNCVTGLAKTEPTVNPYEYKAGDYFIVGTVAEEGDDNYRPSGTSYDKDVPSTTVETGSPIVNDTYYYDGTSWSLLHTQQSSVAWESVAGKPSTFPPSAHVASHKTGGSDALTPGDIGAVAAVPGKQLSTNDYTNADKAEVAKVKDKADEFTAWEFSEYSNYRNGSISSLGDGVWDFSFEKREGNVWYTVSLIVESQDPPLVISLEQGVTATRKRVLRTGDAPATSDILSLCQPFSATKTGGYAVGEFCSHLDGGTLKLYQCTTAHTGAWNAAHFAERDVSALFSISNSALMGVVRYAFNSDGTIKDRAINAITYAGGALPNFPAQVSGYARDFLLNVTATATASDIALPESGATSVGDALAFEASHTYLVAITEIEAKHYYIRIIDTTPQNA